MNEPISTMPDCRMQAITPAEPSSKPEDPAERRDGPSPIPAAMPLYARAHTRTPSKVRAILYLHGTFHRCIVRDYSCTGLGLECDVALYEGDIVRIALLNGQSRTAVIRWWLHNRCGVSFEEKLIESDAFCKVLNRGRVLC